MKLDFYPYPRHEAAREVRRYSVIEDFRTSNVIRISGAVGKVLSKWHFICAQLIDEEMQDYDIIAENPRSITATGAFEKEEIYAETETPPV